MNKVFIASDHAAFEEKEIIKNFLKEKVEVVDLGPFSSERCDYPDFAKAVALEVQSGAGKGVLLCGSGIGVSMAANRFKNVRAALCRSTEDARLSRQHNDANTICVGARISSITEIQEMLKVWLNTDFEEGRHTNRLKKFNGLGE